MGHWNQFANDHLYKSTLGANLERVVLANSKEFFSSKAAAGEKWRTAQDIGSEALTLKKAEGGYGQGSVKDLDDASDDESNFCSKKICWWNPSQDSIAVAFCNETSIHGFKFLGQTKRHLSERIFWLIAFFLSLGAAIYLIYGVWDRYTKIPVIVSFQASEQDIDSIPFPAVTLCNMNKFPKSIVQDLENIVAGKLPGNTDTAKQHLKFVRAVCNAQQSFAKDFHFAHMRGTQSVNASGDTIDEDSQDDMMDFLLTSTLPCDQLIRLCILGEEPKNCSELFRPVITDYGKCCTFNIYPLPLLLHDPQTWDGVNVYKNPVLGSQGRINWPEHELEEWKNWKYEEGYVLPKNITKPWRQKRAGLPYGLSVLVDPNTEEYYCPVSDSEGMRYILHTPLEMPHVMEFASLIDLGKEILIEVHPDMTNADDDIRQIKQEKRKCYFGKEKELKFFGPYTGGNCVDECTALILGDKCNCTFFYMPRDDGVAICNNDPTSKDFLCIDKAKVDLQATLKETCGHCDALCEDIAYNYETTIADLQHVDMLWNDLDPKHHNTSKPPKWANHRMAIVHVFFGSETTVPKYRKRLYGTTDLIANTGGILGLCLGFSVLSGVEVLYFLTLRSFWKYCRRRMVGRRVAAKVIKIMRSKRSKRTINVDPGLVPVYTSNGYPHRWQFNNYGRPSHY